MQKLFLLLENLENTITKFDKTNQKESQPSAGWHIEHSCKVIISIINVLQQSNPETYQRRFNSNRSFVFTFSYIPRGKGKAPKVVLPEGEISEKSLLNSIQKTREKIAQWDNIPTNSHFKHPYLGNLNKSASLRFLHIHTQHHIKIINDICNKA